MLYIGILRVLRCFTKGEREMSQPEGGEGEEERLTEDYVMKDRYTLSGVISMTSCLAILVQLAVQLFFV